MRRELTVACVYTEDGKRVRELLLESFQTFLRQEINRLQRGES